MSEKRMTAMTRRSLIAGRAPPPPRCRTRGPARAAAAATSSWSAPACSAPGPRRSCRRRASASLLLDAWGPAHARASSGGESRMTRAGLWRGRDLYAHGAGFAGRVARAVRALRPADLPSDRRALLLRRDRRLFPRQSMRGPSAARPSDSSCWTAPRCARRFPMIDFTGIDAGLFEPRLRRADGAARGADPGRASSFARGGDYRRGAVLPPDGCATRSTRSSPLRASGSRPATSSSPAGPGCRKLFPDAARPPHLPDPAGGVLLRAAGGRHALRGRRACPAGPTSTAATSITASRISKAAASRSPTTRTAPAIDPDTRRPHRLAGGAGATCAPSWPAAFRRCADRRSTRRGSASMRTARTAIS